MKRKTWGLFSTAFFTILSVFYYQACTQTHFSPTQSSTQSLALSGNGDSYSGKLSYFNSVDVGNACHKLSNQGKPFPRQQIFFVNGRFSLVRDNCEDITPRPLDATSIQVDASGESLIYQGLSFDLQTDLSEYDQVSVVCPAGKSIDSSLGNLFSNSINLATSDWHVHSEIAAQLDGSLEALPKFRIEVTDPNRLEDWIRVSQNPALSPSTQYVTTFLLQAGNVNFATISYNEQPEGQFVIAVDLVNAQAYVQYQIGAASPIITAVERYGNAVAISVAFTSSALMDGPGGDLGVAPFRPNNNDKYAFGDYIFATAAHLHRCR